MNLSIANLELATQYFLGDKTLLNTKDEYYKNLFLSYVSDNNSSTMRELVTMHYLKYKSYDQKHGADGYDPKTGKNKEVKPRFIQYGKLGNSGNFNDMTIDLLAKKKDFDVVCSLFSQDRLIYIVEFPIMEIYAQLQKPILSASIGRRVVCHFSYSHYDCHNLIVHYFDAESAIRHKCLSAPHFKMLERRNTNVSIRYHTE